MLKYNFYSIIFVLIAFAFAVVARQSPIPSDDEMEEQIDENQIDAPEIPSKWISFFEEHGEYSLVHAVRSGNPDREMLVWLSGSKGVPIKDCLNLLVENDDIELLDFFLSHLEICGVPNGESFMANEYVEECRYAFMDAIEKGDLDMVDLFASKVGNVQLLAYFVSYAVGEGQQEILEYLLQFNIKLDDTADFLDLGLPLDEALFNNHLKVANFLLHQDFSIGTFYTLLLAARTGDLEIFTAVKTKYGPFWEQHVLNADLLSGIVTGQTEKVKELLDKGANPNAAVGYVKTFLAEAIEVAANIDIVMLLFTKGGLFDSKSESWPDLPNFRKTFFQTTTGVQFVEIIIPYFPGHLLWPFLKSVVYSYTLPYGISSSYDSRPVAILISRLLQNHRLNYNALFACLLNMTESIMKNDLQQLEDVLYKHPQKFKFIAGLSLGPDRSSSSLVDIAFQMGRFQIVVFLIMNGGVSTSNNYRFHKDMLRNRGVEETEEERVATEAIKSTKI